MRASYKGKHSSPAERKRDRVSAKRVSCRRCLSIRRIFPSLCSEKSARTFMLPTVRHREKPNAERSEPWVFLPSRNFFLPVQKEIREPFISHIVLHNTHRCSSVASCTSRIRSPNGNGSSYSTCSTCSSKPSIVCWRRSASPASRRNSRISFRSRGRGCYKSHSRTVRGNNDRT